MHAPRSTLLPATRAAALRVAVCLLTLGVGPGATEAAAQFSARSQLTFLATGQPTATAGLEFRRQLGEPPLPDGTGPVTAPAGDWMLSLALHGGVTFIDVAGKEASFTALAQVGVLRRTPILIDRVGLVLLGNRTPEAIGPALRLEAMNVAGVQGGWVWTEGDDGVLVTIDVALSLLFDLFTR